MYIYQSKNEVNEQFGRKLNQDVNGNRKLFWKVTNEKEGKMERCSGIKDGNGRLELGEVEVRRIEKEYFEDFYNINTRKKAAVHIYGFDGKMHPVILVDRIHRVTGGLIDNYEQGSFGEGRGCVDQIFTLKQIDEKAQEKKRRVYVDFMDLEKAHDTVNKEALWRVLRMYDVGGKLLSGIKRMYVSE